MNAGCDGLRMVFRPIKRMVWLIVVLGSFVNVVAAQGATANPAILFQVSFEPYTNVFWAENVPGACGHLWLEGTNLSYHFAASRTNSISIRGPGNPGEPGPVLYEIDVGTNSFNATSYCNAAAEIPPGPDPYPPTPVDPRFPPPPRPPYYWTYRITTGTVAIMPEQTAEIVAGMWTATFTATVRGPHRVQDLLFGGPILILDSDGDGIPDYLDDCRSTPAGSLVNASGCSIADLCPCEGDWKNHGEFERCVKEAAKDFKKARLITEKEKHEIEKAAHESDCGKPEKPEKPPKPPKPGKE